MILSKLLSAETKFKVKISAKFNFDRSSAPDPVGGTYSTPPGPIVEFKRPYIKGEEGKGRDGKEREGRGGEETGREGDEKGRDGGKEREGRGRKEVGVCSTNCLSVILELAVLAYWYRRLSHQQS